MPYKNQDRRRTIQQVVHRKVMPALIIEFVFAPEVYIAAMRIKIITFISIYGILD